MRSLALAAAALSGAACGGGVLKGNAGDGGTADTGATDGTTLSPMDGGATFADGGRLPLGDGGASSDDSGAGVEPGGGIVDAGYYHGDGSFWVDGGAYPGLPDGSQGETDASSTGDASTGVTVLVSQIQVTPNRMVSDGTLLFWTNPGLYAMPVGGGAITTLLAEQTGAPSGGSFLAVDDVNLYVLIGSSLIRMPKNGDPATLVNESGATVIDATMLGSRLY